jgi:hypothetical protein
VVGVATVIAGGDVGASMVFKMGHRVEAPGSEGTPSKEAEPADLTQGQAGTS